MNLQFSQIFTLLIMPVLAGGIGWFTNWVAIKMLLRPIHPVKVLGITFQGLLPKRHEELAKRISKAIAKDFLTEANIIEIIHRIDLGEVIKTYIRKKWDEKIDDILSFIPMIKMFLPAEKLNGIRDKIVDSFGANPEEFAQMLSDGMAGKINLEETIEKNILKFDLEQLESIIEEIAHKEFRYIEILGGVLGFIIGLVQSILIYLCF